MPQTIIYHGWAFQEAAAFTGIWHYLPRQEMQVFKNVASQKIILFAFDSTTGLPATGDAANLTAYVSKDDGAVTMLGDTSATELDATNAKGDYSFDLTQAETNANKLHFSGKSTTDNIVVVPRTIYTLPPNFSSLGIESDGDLTKVNTLDGHTPQTGDSFARIGATGSGLTSLASQASVNTIDDFLDTEIAAILAAVDTEVAAILADTNELQADWANGGRLDLILDARASQASVDTIDGIVDAILVDTGTTLDGKLDTIDTNVDAILVDTAEIGAAGAGLTALATQASVDAIPTAIENADAVLSRNVSNVEATCPEHCLATIVLATLEYTISGATWIIQRTDGSTTHAAKTLTTNASAEQVTAVE